MESESLGTSEEVSLESLHEAGNYNEVTFPDVQVVQESRAKRSTRDDAQVEVIKLALKDVADAFRESIAAYEKSHQIQKLIPEEEVWKLLEEVSR